MGVAIAVAGTLAFSGPFALLLVRMPGLAIGKRPRASLIVAILGTLVATAVVAILIGAPLIYGMSGTEWWPSISTNYFLAMAHRLIDSPYPFYWTPRWMYVVGSVMPLIALGACVALGAGLTALSHARWAAAVIVSFECCLLVAYLVAGVYASAATLSGVPL